MPIPRTCQRLTYDCAWDPDVTTPREARRRFLRLFGLVHALSFHVRVACAALEVLAPVRLHSVALESFALNLAGIFALDRAGGLRSRCVLTALAAFGVVSVRSSGAARSESHAQHIHKLYRR
ncbi:unnamed protein product [Linum trigynum]|uniref:Uncharacterized protein n=1 Tax=Linum trigynum TaxID=586398 RepID=A0AAV2E4X2_9ROSI